MLELRHNLNARHLPTQNDDSLDGWDVGSFWIVQKEKKIFQAAGVEPSDADWVDLTESGGVTRFLKLKDVPDSFEGAEGYALQVANGAVVFTLRHHYEAMQGRALATKRDWYTFPLGGARVPSWDRNLGSVKSLPSAYFGVDHKGLVFGTSGAVNAVKIYASTGADDTQMEWRLYKNTRSNGKAEVGSREMGVLAVTMQYSSRIYIGTMQLTEPEFAARDSLVLAWRRKDGGEDTRTIEAEIALDITF